MKAARIHQHGSPEVLVYEDVPDPKIKANQILVRVRACSLNHLDLFVRAGIPGMKWWRWANCASASSRAGACCSHRG
jgi:NADPH:quinone reductase-like Zn-dependent oxidoreductase